MAGNLNFYVELYQMVAEAITGSFHDLLGRRIVFLSGFLLLATGLFLQPYMPNIYPCLLITRFAAAYGITCLIVNPLVNDYVLPQSQGLASAYGGVLGGAGVVFSMLVLNSLATFLPLESIFIISGGVAIAGFIYSLIFLKNNYPRTNRYEPFCSKLKAQLRALSHRVRTNTVICLAFLGTFVIKCQDVVLSVYLTLYVGVSF